MKNAGPVLIAIAIAAAAIYFVLQEQTTANPGDTENVNSQGSPNVISGIEIAQYAEGAGFTGSDIDDAVAVALAESGGNTNAYNPETAAGTPEGQGSFGLWQIYLKAHPEYSGVNLLDPAENAAAAFAIFQSAGGFTPWSTFKSGAYEAFVGQSGSIAEPGPTVDTSGDTGDDSGG